MEASKLQIIKYTKWIITFMRYSSHRSTALRLRKSLCVFKGLNNRDFHLMKIVHINDFIHCRNFLRENCNLYAWNIIVSELLFKLQPTSINWKWGYKLFLSQISQFQYHRFIEIEGTPEISSSNRISIADLSSKTWRYFIFVSIII